ncbi:MAG: Na+/H+ antiporter NhaC [Bacteroidota bacterium]|nr:Na+/H+ antiporter NhaC [Bacteroidota bacterium]
MNRKNNSYYIAFLPIIILIILLSSSVYIYGSDSLSGPNQLALLFSAAIAALIGIMYYDVKWETILIGIEKSISSTTSAMIILLLIGALAGTWLISGVIPAMIYYGLQILNPKIFLFASCIICAIVSASTGSSWSTIATIGIALLGIGKALEMSEGLVAGSIISGAYFGDKMSPLSDTTNLASAMAGTDLFKHIKYMMYTTVPSFIITLIIFISLGADYTIDSSHKINTLLETINNKFIINEWLFTLPLLVILLIIKKIPAIPTLLIATILGGLFAILFQPNIILSISESNILSFKTYYMALINAMGNKISIETGNDLINSLFQTGGMSGMLNTIWLIICAMSFGGVMESCGFLKRIIDPIIKYAKNTGSLITTTAGTCIFFNITTSDQYLSIVVPGRMFSEAYKKHKLSKENLSRTLEDSGTVTSVLIPWNTCGATQSAILGVATLTYLPYCFFNLISPIMTIIYAYLGIKIKKISTK